MTTLETFRAERDAAMSELAQALLTPVTTDLASGDVATSLARTAGLFYRQVSPESTNGETAGFIASLQPALKETTSDSSPTTVSTWLATAITNGAALLNAADGSALTWVTMRDEDVRDGHRSVHGQVRRLGQPFAVMGQELRYPGEPVGPPDVWINCRCALHAGRTALSIQTMAVTPEPTPAKPDNLVLVAIPAPEDPIYQASSEKVPHLTLVFLGTADADLGSVHQAVLNAAEQMPGPITLPVASRGTLGDDEADVVHLDGSAMAPARDAMLADPYVKDAYESIKQFPTWKPHLTLGYPESPAKGDPGESITFDRLAVWDGDYSGKEYAMGTKPADPMPVDEDVEFAAEPDLAPPEPSQDEEYDGESPLTWHGVLAPEGVWSGDRRRFAENAMTWRDLPLPLSWQKATADGHDGSVVVGAITDIQREGNLLRAKGTWSNTPETDEVIGLMADGAVRGVSVDVDSAEMTLSDEDTDHPGMTLTSGRISGATICAIPAFAEAFVSLGDAPEVGTDGDVFRDVSTKERKRLAGEGNALPDGSFPIANLDDLRNAIQAIGRAKDPAKAKAHIKKRARALGHPELIPDSWSEEDALAADGIPDSAIPTGPGDKRGPGWLTDPRATRRIHAYWTHPDQPGYAKIGWGRPGDFNRCRAQLAKYIGPKFLNRTCAEWHHDALGIWPGEHAADLKASSDCSDCGPALSLVAAAPEEPLPHAWFMSPGLDGPTPLTSDGDHIYGHLALWNACHIGKSGMCVTPPHSMTNYAHFRTGSVLTEAGRVPVGQITMDTGHADLSLGASATKAHYDDTGMAVADIAVGEDAYGIWLNGALRPTLDATARRALFAAAISGDWRGIGGSLEMVGALAVNIPGFAVPQVSLAAAGDEQISLVAAGVLAPSPKVPSTQELAAAVVDEMVARAERKERARETMSAAREIRVAKVQERV